MWRNFAQFLQDYKWNPEYIRFKENHEFVHIAKGYVIDKFFHTLSDLGHIGKGGNQTSFQLRKHSARGELQEAREKPERIKHESSTDNLEGSEETTPITNIENAAENGKTASFARKHLEVGIYQENTSRNIPQVKKRNL